MKTKMNKKQVLQFSSIVMALTAITLFLGHGCSGYKSSSQGSQSPGPGLNGDLCVADSLEVVPIPGAQTLSIAYGEQVFDNMVSCTSLAEPSQATLDEYDARKGSFSQFGSVTDVTSAMMMGVAALALEVCNDLAEQETDLPADTRRFFTAFDFSANDANNSALQDAAQRFARSCWGRNATDEEIGIIQTNISQLMTNAETPHYKAIGVCASVLGSLEGIIQ